MIKKLMMLCVAAMAATGAWAATETVNGIEWVYEVSDNGVIVVEAFRNGKELPWALDSDGVLVVPEKLGGYFVREIGDKFMPGGHDETLKRVVLPNSIVKIGQSAFEGNNALSEINFPEGLKELSYKSFEECGLEKIIIPEGVTEIPENCFRQCYSLVDVWLPKSLKNIRMSAFEECPKLKAIHCAGEKPKLDPYALYKSPNAVFYSGVGVENYAVSAYVAKGCERMGVVSGGGKTAKPGEPLTLKATPNKGYIFDGWYDADGNPFPNDRDFRLAQLTYTVGQSDVDMFARFVPDQVKVNFNPNEGFSSETIRDVLKGCAIDVLPVPTRSGYAFVGWYTAKAGGTKVTADTKVSANVTYYARWEILSFKLVLHKNDGTGTTKEISVKYGSPVVLPGAAKTLKWGPRRGFSFMGWATAEKSKNVFLKDQEKVTTSLSSKDTLHVYAIWQLKPSTSYAVQYIRNDGSGSVRTIGFNGGIATKLNSVKALGFERRGYTFVGWATSTANARDKKVWQKDMGVVSQPVANGKLLQIYAIWKLTPGYYSIRFNKNDGSGKWRELGYKYGDNTTLPTIENGLQWSRAGYKFGGWATSAANAANGIAWRGDKGITRTPVAAGKTLNVYAIWRKSGAAAMSVNTTFALSSSAQSLSSSSGANEPAKLLPGYYSGELADGTGTYDLLVDEDGETGYVHILFDDGSVVSGEVEVDFLDDIILVTEEAEELYLLMR